jgi:tetratricopeptide (TPR) repeat protein
MPNVPQSNKAVEVFYSYAHNPDDEKLKDELLKQLAGVERQGVIVSWHDRKITAGREWAGEIDEHINTAGVILLLVSPDFMASGYCNDVELNRAMERHEAGEARVIPVILRPTLWKGAPFEKLQMLPTDARAVTLWPNRDEALLVVAEGIYKAVQEVAARTLTKEPKQTSGANIPRPPVVGFVARRDKEGRDIVGLLKEELAPDKNQLVALWGPGGAGKTTIAAEVVRATEDDFKGRVVWASPLRRADFNSATLLDEIATQLGREDLRRLAPEPKAAQVAALVSQAPTLVILDNFETVPEDEQTRCLDFLAQSAACPVLITTRGFIDRDDVTNIELAAMEMDEAREFLRRLIERTPKSQNFANLDHDDLIQKCEANPLLLQWVVRQIVLSKTPKTALDYLSQGEGDAAERIFTRSFNLPQLGDDGRAALLALSLFTPSASREALAEVAGFGDDLRRLDKAVESLSSLWLVETTEGNERLFLRGLTRELAKSRLSKNASAKEFRQRYIACFLRHAEAHLQPTPEGLNALEQEKDNFFGAMDASFATEDWASVIGIHGALSDFLLLHGYWDEAIQSGKQAAAAAIEAKDDLNVDRFTVNMAVMRRFRGEYEEASRILREVLLRFRRLKDEKKAAICLHELGVIAASQGKVDEARWLYEESLEISKRLSLYGHVSKILYQLAMLEQDKGQMREARRLYDESLEISRRHGNQHDVAMILNALGTLVYSQGEIEEARRLYNESLEMMRRFGDQYGIAGNLHNLGKLAQERNELEEAWQLYNESLEIEKRLGNQDGIAISIHHLGLLAEHRGNKMEAARLFREALSIFEKLGSPEAKKVRKDLKRVERVY